MTTDEAANVFTSATTATLLTYQAAGRVLAAEVRRLDAMRCETCKHNDYGDCARTLHVERSDMGTKFESWTQCETLGSGCRAWEKRDERT